MFIKTYNQNGEEVGQIKLASEIFGFKLKPELIHQVVVIRQANLRKPWAQTKTRGEVRGGGRKPWQQKGTGRARAGSIRSPLWRGGGIIFGPRKERNFFKKNNKKVKKMVLLMALSEKVRNSRLVILEKIEMKTIKTKIFSEFIRNLQKKIKNFGRKILIVLPSKNEEIEKSAKNIKEVKVVKTENLNLLDILKFDTLLTTLEGLKKMEEIFKSSKIS